MAHARIDRKGFLKSLGLAAAACAARPASALSNRVGENQSKRVDATFELPRKTTAAGRIVAYRGPGV